MGTDKQRRPLPLRARPLMRRVTWRPLGGLLGRDTHDASQSLVALVIAILVTLVAGLLLASVEEVLIENLGLLLIFPAAIGLRGNVFGPFVSRLSTSMRAGTFSWSLKTDGVLVQNLIAVVGTSFLASMVVGVIAKGVAELTISSPEVLSLLDFVTVSVVSAAIATIALTIITLLLATVSTRNNWDLDNVTAPIVTAAGDLVTLPALLVGIIFIQSVLGSILITVLGAIIVALSVVAIISLGLKTARRVCIESAPVLILAGIVSLLAGSIIEGAIDSLASFTVYLVVLPSYLSVAGALGGILSNRLSTKLHLGLVSPTSVPRGAAAGDILLIFRIAIPILVALGLSSFIVAEVFDHSTPQLAALVLSILSGGLVATIFVSIVAYYGTILVVRFGLDPDNHGIPVVTASLDLVGSLTLIGAVWAWVL